MLTTETARLELNQEYPEFAMEILEYLSFADIEKLTKEDVIEDFKIYLEK